MAYDNIKIEKSLYTTGKSFSQALEKLDPSENYKGTELAGLDAFERQLKRFDIKVSGPDSDTVSKFFKTTDSAALFPEFVSRAVAQGMKGNCKIENIIATVTKVDSLDYRSINVSSLDECMVSYVQEGGIFPEATITVQDKLTKLGKYGALLSASYEAIKFQKLDIFSLALRKLGENISYSQFHSVVREIIDTYEIEFVTTEDSVLTYNDMVKLWIKLSPYNMTTMICNKNTLEKVLNIPEFRDINTGLDFNATGKLITPFGAEIIVDETTEDNVIIGLDKNYAIEKVEACGITTDFDKMINRQLERATISTIVGFTPIFLSAIVALEIKE